MNNKLSLGIILSLKVYPCIRRVVCVVSCSGINISTYTCVYTVLLCSSACSIEHRPWTKGGILAWGANLRVIVLFMSINISNINASTNNCNINTFSNTFVYWTIYIPYNTGNSVVYSYILIRKKNVKNI